MSGKEGGRFDLVDLEAALAGNRSVMATVRPIRAEPRPRFVVEPALAGPRAIPQRDISLRLL